MTNWKPGVTWRQKLRWRGWQLRLWVAEWVSFLGMGIAWVGRWVEGSYGRAHGAHRRAYRMDVERGDG